jgi:hypothetical protein
LLGLSPRVSFVDTELKVIAISDPRSDLLLTIIT